MKFYVYIVECADKTLYVGCTNSLQRRIKEHNASKRGARYTKTRRPVELKYSETFSTLKDAMRREREIKSWPRKKKIDLINKIWVNA